MKFSLLDLIFPRFCSGCHRLGSYVCVDCRRQLRYLQCDTEIEGIHASSAVVAYAGTVAKIIKDGKYRLASAVLEEFLEVIEPELVKRVEGLKGAAPAAWLQPVPLHPKRYRARGFNQSDIIAKRIANLTGMNVVSRLRRVRHNPPQARLPHAGGSRAENVRGIFEIIPGADLKGQDFILVDDVVTTGSTVAEAARTLIAAGARHIAVISLAKG